MNILRFTKYLITYKDITECLIPDTSFVDVTTNDLNFTFAKDKMFQENNNLNLDTDMFMEIRALIRRLNIVKSLIKFRLNFSHKQMYRREVIDLLLKGTTNYFRKTKNQYSLKATSTSINKLYEYLRRTYKNK